jgi:hypothetical protein
MSGRPWTQQIAPWSGLFVGAAAWFADQRVMADGNSWDCARVGGPVAIGVGAVCLVLTVVGGLASWRSVPRGIFDPTEVRGFAGFVGMAAAGIFALAIVFGTWAGLLVPACQR